ncbi:MAG: hypothetical protein M3Q97_07700 [Bacteroidota bacterium]|nr:hypothetical protein [Bacteroidota bacterium]
MRKGMLILLLALICGGASNQADSVLPEHVTNIRQDTFAIGSIQFYKAVILLVNDYSCTGCKESAFDFLNSLNFDSSAKLFAIGRVSNDIMTRRIFRSFISQRLQGLSDVFYDIHYEQDPYPPLRLNDGLFGRFGISSTPVILLVDKNAGTHRLISYKEMYEETTLTVSCRTAVAKFVRGN